ncbi:hypothetical protein GQ457_06G017370 [Hibiscus cannabinus]
MLWLVAVAAALWVLCFSVVAVKVYNPWGFGGILFSEKGEIRAIFSGPVLKSDVAGSFGGRTLLVESRSRIVVNWVYNPLQRPGNICQILADIDSLKLQIKHISFVARSSSSSESAAWLAKDGVSRRETFRAWW